MPELVAVSRERHQRLTWQRPTGYQFAAQDAVAFVTSQEVPRAMASMALAFVEIGGTYAPVVVQGLRPGQNRFVGRDGRWLGDYLPAPYRAHPFGLARNADNMEVLCIDEAAGRVGESDTGEAFFAGDGSPAQAVAEAFKVLTELERDRARTLKACELLYRHGLLEPWQLQAQDGDEILETKGLFRIAEAKLYSLEPAALVDIRDGGALMLAYAQLFSMQQIHKLGKLGATASANPGTQQAPALSEDNGIISFENL